MQYDTKVKHREWTDEAAYINSTNNNVYSNSTWNTYMLRGGSFNNVNSNNTITAFKADFRNYDYALNARTNYGFRSALYIK